MNEDSMCREHEMELSAGTDVSLLRFCQTVSRESRPCIIFHFVLIERGCK